MSFTDSDTFSELDPRNALFSYDANKEWAIVYERLKNQSTVNNKDISCDVARDVHNRWKNRYRDISPYDATRVPLRSALDGDYINASFVSVSEAPQRRYILTQGPMPQTVGHFWLMVWEQRTPAIIMLNRIFEKGTIRCHSYFPVQSGPVSLTFAEFGLEVRLLQEERMQTYIRRLFDVIHLNSDEHHSVIHLHYTTWPDFGVPNSPSDMLDFLWTVRAIGALDDPNRPSVIHCSAGVGRSGAFVCIDLALLLLEDRGTLDGFDLSQLFLELRKCRMGIIQTADQLRFCYLAVVHGGEQLLATPVDERPFIQFKPIPDEDNFFEEGTDSEDQSDESEQEFNSSEEDVLVLDVDDEDQERYAGSLDDIRNEGATFDVAIGSDENGSFSKQTCKVRRRSVNPIFTSGDSDSMGAAVSTTSVGVGPGSREPGVGTQQHGWMTGSRVTSSFMDTTDLTVISSRYTNHFVPDRSNNALSTTGEDLKTSNRVCVQDNDEESLVRFRDNRDSNTAPPEQTDGVSTVSTSIDDQVALNKDDAEYLTALTELQHRREVRRRRQIRMKEQLAATLERIRQSDLERKRWVPARLLRLLRRVYVESGYIRGPVSAALVTTLFLSVSGTVGVCIYRWLTNT